MDRDVFPVSIFVIHMAWEFVYLAALEFVRRFRTILMHSENSKNISKFFNTILLHGHVFQKIGTYKKFLKSDTLDSQ